MKTTDLHYSAIPALAQYIDRVGAEQLNFRTFMVKEHKGKYYIERSVIRINADGDIFSSNKDFDPTEQEAAQIKGALMSLNFPKSVVATEAQFKKLLSKLKGTQVYPMWSRGKVAGVAMAQQRVEREDGKHYIPWTMWSDGEWRAMEPDGKLPFFKPKAKGSNKVMIHEGAKAAAAAEAKANDKTHPWQEFLEQYDHWGILGGALAPHRADYAELAKEQPIEVIYVCDRDFPGEEALEAVSKNWGRPLKGLKFDKTFPTSWDMADDLPQQFFKGDLYIGPDVRDMLKPATWATEMVKEEESNRKHPVLMRQFKEEWVHTISPEFFIHKDWPTKLYDADSFKSAVAPFSHRCDIAAMVRGSDANKVETIDYRPDFKPGLYVINKRRVVNTCQPREVDPVDGDYSLWIEYMTQMIPDEKDRHELMKWCATLICRPEIRMTYSVLLVSEMHGVGKTTLGEKILAPIIGKGNCSFPSEKDICDSSFNGWLARKRLIVVNEIYAGNSSKAYNQLKSVVADATVDVNEKFVKAYTVQNWAHVIASSNSMRELRIDPDDRRWLVPGVTEDKVGAKFWRDFNGWLTNDHGLGKIVHWAEKFVQENGHVQQGEHAPTTSAKDGVIEEGYSPGMAEVRDLLYRIEEEGGLENKVIIDVDLVEYIRHKVYGGREVDRLERPLTVRKVAKQMGWHSGPKNRGCPEWNLPRQRGRVLSMRQNLAKTDPRELAKIGVERIKPLDYLRI